MKTIPIIECPRCGEIMVLLYDQTFWCPRCNRIEIKEVSGAD